MSQPVTREQLEAFYEANPKASVREVAEHFGVAQSTVRTVYPRGRRGAPLTLTPHDLQVYEAIADSLVERGWAPSVTEIAEAVPCARSAAHTSLHRLAAFGAIVLGDGPRTIRVVGSAITMPDKLAS
jgi:DNA-binding IclR family transcriptional regulator